MLVLDQIQGGDPTGTGTGGKSIWKKPFQDEIRLNLKHEGVCVYTHVYRSSVCVCVCVCVPHVYRSWCVEHG